MLFRSLCLGNHAADTTPPEAGLALIHPWVVPIAPISSVPTESSHTASDDPSTTNSKSSVRRVNWKGGLGGGEVGWGSGAVMAVVYARFYRAIAVHTTTGALAIAPDAEIDAIYAPAVYYGKAVEPMVRSPVLRKVGASKLLEGMQ